MHLLAAQTKPNQDQIFRKDFICSGSPSPPICECHDTFNLDQCLINSDKHVCLFNKKIICQNFAYFAMQFIIGWIQTSKQTEKSDSWLGIQKWLFIQEHGIPILRNLWTYLPNLSLVCVKGNSQRGPGCDHWMCSNLLKPTADQNRTSFSEAYSRTGSHSLVVALAPWFQGSSQSRNMHSEVAFWPATLNSHIMAINGGCILSFIT